MNRYILRVLKGPMFAGKTSQLLRDIRGFSPKYESSYVMKWSFDDRSGSPTTIASHDGVKYANAQSFSTLDDLPIDYSMHKSAFVAVDDAHFFGDDLGNLWHRLRENQDAFMLVLSAVDYDFRKQRMGKVLELIDDVEAMKQTDPEIFLDVNTMTSTCTVCGENAEYTMRKSSQKEQIVVGGSDLYMPVCTQHHFIIDEGEEQKRRTC